MDSSVRERWQGDGGALAAEVFSRLKGGKTLADLELGEVDGRIDLRGLPAQLPQREYLGTIPSPFTGKPWVVSKPSGQTLLEGVALAGLDLTGAFLDQVTMRDCVIQDCLLDEAHCHDLGLVRCQVHDVRFRGADLRGSVLGSWRDGKGSEYQHVDFTAADLREATPITAWLTDCDFSAARLDGVKFRLSGLVRCRFSGLLDETEFDGRLFSRDDGTEPNTAEDVDLSATVLRAVKFRGFDLDAVRLPAQPGLRVVRNYPCVLEKVLELIAGQESELASTLRYWIAHWQRGLRGHPLGLLNRDDLIRHGRGEFADFAEAVFTDAERLCAGS
jgi:uncharacterized protein YjbI with pentapeptide repeats